MEESHDMQDYIDDLLQISPDAIIINGTSNETVKKKKIKKIIKKKISKNKSAEINKEETETSNKENESSKDNNITSNSTLIDMHSDEIFHKNSNPEENFEKNDEIDIIDEDSLEDDNFEKIEEKENDSKINKSTVKENKGIKKHIVKKTDKYNYDFHTIEKYQCLIKSKLLFEFKNILKEIFLFQKLKKHFILISDKISSIYKGYLLRKNIEVNYLVQRVLECRNECASKIIAYYKGYYIRKLAKTILQKKENNYIIYSSLSNNKKLYFKISYISGLGENVYFEFCKLLKCFITYVSRKDRNLSKKTI